MYFRWEAPAKNPKHVPVCMRTFNISNKNNARVLVADVQKCGEEDDPDQYWLGWATRVAEVHTTSGMVPADGSMVWLVLFTTQW